MQTAVATDDYSFEVWKDNALHLSRGSDLRFGQALFNTAPDHIAAVTGGVMELDPFNVDTPDRMYVINNFLLFAYLAWDVVDGTQLDLAAKMVMNEPNARRG